MNIRRFVFIITLVLFLPAQADVFKCKLASGKIVYQSEQCAKNTVQQGVVKVKKLSPEEAEAAQARLRAWQEQQAVEDAAKKEAEKARQAELQQQESLELQRRSVAAQERQASQTQRGQGYGAGLYDPRYRYNYPYGGYGRYPNHPGPYMPNDHNYGGQYYQYPDSPKRRPGEYPFPSPPSKPRPIKLPESEE